MGRFSETLMDHFLSPRNAGALVAPDRVGQAGAPGRGPYMTLHLRLDGGTVVAAGFQTYGCGASTAAGSMLTEMIVGRSVEACRDVTAALLSEALGGFPPDKQHCPVMAVAALRDALEPSPGQGPEPGKASSTRGDADGGG
jgi:nitrogen fixation NifU-like protein